MSYQTVESVAVTRPSGGRAMTALGVVAVLAGLAGGAALYFGAQQRFDSRVKSLASESGALSGCVTDLTFTKTGTFVLYYLSEGRVRVNGANDGCAESDSIRLSADEDPPDLQITLTDDSDDSIRLSRPSLDPDTALEAGGVVAWPYRQAVIESRGDYQIEITADDSTPRFAIGLGPKIEEPSIVVSLLVAAIGLAVGILCFIVAGVQRSAARRQATGTAVGVGYPGPAVVFQSPGQYPNQPPVVYQAPQPQGFDHPTQAMPPIQATPDPVGPFAPPAASPPASGPPPATPQYSPPESTGWTAPGQPLPPPAAPVPYDEERGDQR